MRYADVDGVLAVAHRGGAGLVRENEMAAFAHAHALGYRRLETDVRLSADGVAVCLHDASLRRTTGLPVRPGQLGATALAALGVPALEDVLGAFPDTGLVVDVKEPAVVPALARALRRTSSAGRVCLAGAADAVLGPAAAELGTETALGWGSLAALLAGRRPTTTGARFAHLPTHRLGVRLVTPRVVERAHAHGLRLLVWTVDDPAEQHRLLDDGADGVITDRPDVLREVLVSRGQWVRPAGWAAGSAGGSAAGRPPARRPGPPVRAGAPSSGSRAPDGSPA